jgi:hypothetical protein
MGGRLRGGRRAVQIVVPAGGDATLLSLPVQLEQAVPGPIADRPSLESPAHSDDDVAVMRCGQIGETGLISARLVATKGRR